MLVLVLKEVTSVHFLLLFLPQAHEAVIRGQYPAPEETLQFLAAVRLQYLLGDYSSQTSVPEISQVFSMARLRARVQNSAKTFAPGGSAADRSGTSERKRSSFLEGTLRRSFRSGSLSRQRLEEENSLEAWLREEAAAVRASVVDKWRKLQGMVQEQAMVKYMSVVKEWQGYGSTLFNVEVGLGARGSVRFLFTSAPASFCLFHLCVRSVTTARFPPSCGWASAARPCLCTNEVNSGLWRFFPTNRSCRLERRCPTPTRSVWRGGS